MARETVGARTWALAAALALAVHGTGIVAIARVKVAGVVAPTSPIEFELREPPPPPEAVTPPPELLPPPPVAPPPKPRMVVARHAPSPPTPAAPPSEPPPPSAPADPPPAEAPKEAPPVFGVAMASVTSGEAGMAVPVGNTLMAKPTEARKGEQTPPLAAGNGAGAGAGCRPLAGAYIATPPRVLVEVNSADYYPADALALGLEGEVTLSVGITEKGTVVEVRVLKRAGNKFDDAAAQALRKFRFSPALTSEGRAVPTRITYSYKFHLGD